MTLVELFTQVSGDYDQTLRRFAGNAGMLEHFVKKFPQDPTYHELEAAVNGQDYTMAERYAHTIKGTAANLGFQQLSNCSAALVEAVRQGDFTRVAPCFKAIQEEYGKLMEWIHALG